ncbi:alpha-E domain-containing protein [Oceanicella sp. SM1341]|uniref:alpha-E domain-containing protein n=1 Tax=Oceanicella sp. SM1341 TaxID=1548889 RepID=UPI000E542BA0|nr:alpha-E domain-containing protein [Oceanicella sp. SM1341]
MLSRTAENLYWMSRYLERAESTARLIEMGQRMALLPGSAERQEWRSVIMATGAEEYFDEGKTLNEAAIVRGLVLDQDNPSSIHACLTRARANAKAIRTALTQEMWEALNDGWRRLENVDEITARRELPTILDWVKARAAMFRGASETSMLRNDGYAFLRLGGHMERADMTLRLLNVKYFVLLPESDIVGGGRDHHQWTSVLWALSAMRSFHHIYKGDYAPWKIADFVILNGAFPRSVTFCYRQISQTLDHLELAYGQRHPCHDLASAGLDRLNETGIGEVFRNGLHEFVDEFIGVTAKLSREVSLAYHF